MWIWAIASFVPAVLMCFLQVNEKYVVLSLVLLFVSQQAIFVFANPSWGFSFGSDQINDFHIASVLSQMTHFTLGQVGYVQRMSYSYYPMIHLFSVLMSDISAVPLITVALYAVPFLNPILVTIALFYLNSELFGLKGLERNIATLFFDISFYYTAFQSEFVRETFAFPMVMLCFLLLAKTAKSNNRSYSYIIILLVVVITLSHQVSSFLFVGILAVMAFAFAIFNKNSRLNRFFFIAAIALSAYTVFEALTFSSAELGMTVLGLAALFTRETSVTVLSSSSKILFYLSLSYYAVLGVLIVAGGWKLIREKKKNLAILFILSVFTAMFVLSVLLRLSTSASPWSWTYYMGLRGTIWAFVGVSVIASVGAVSILKFTSKTRIGMFLLVLIVCLLAAGKFSQYPTLVTNASDQPITYTRYVGALWLRSNTFNATPILIAPYQQDPNGFEAARDMAPYAYLNEDFLGNNGTIGQFYGYIPFVGSYFEQYLNSPIIINSTIIQIVYNNGPVEVGYRQPPS
jgi:hypothetical protein